MNSLLLTLTALVILVLSALFAAPLFIDWNDYRPAIEAQMTKLTGRDVKIDGKVHLIVLPAPQLKFDDIKVADADGGLETPFLEAKVLEAKLHVGTLLTGKVEAHQLTIVDPTVRLRLNGTGGGNWADLGPLKSGGSFVPTDVLLDSVYVSGGTLEVAKDDGTAHVFRDIDGEASASSLAGPYKVEATYNLNRSTFMVILDLGIPPGFSVQTGDLAALVKQGLITKYSLTGRQITLYVGEMRAHKPLRLSYRLKAKFPIKAKTPRSVAYEYYTPTSPGVQEPELIVVKK